MHNHLFFLGRDKIVFLLFVFLQLFLRAHLHAEQGTSLQIVESAIFHQILDSGTGGRTELNFVENDDGLPWIEPC